jgi:hypothetical protein
VRPSRAEVLSIGSRARFEADEQRGEHSKSTSYEPAVSTFDDISGDALEL